MLTRFTDTSDEPEKQPTAAVPWANCEIDKLFDFEGFKKENGIEWLAN